MDEFSPSQRFLQDMFDEAALGTSSTRDHARSMKPVSFPETLRDYFSNTQLTAELFFCVLLFAIAYKTPYFLFDHHMRSIPYQKTSNGDIILDLYIDRDYSQRPTVPSWLLITSCDVLPLLILLFHGRRKLSDLHSSFCAFFAAMGTTGFLTNSIKLYTGYFRPCFYNYCGYNPSSNTCESLNPYATTDSRMSFPSGHSSNSFCSMTIISMYFLGKVANPLQIHPSPLQKILYLLALSPMLWAFFVAASRVHDDMHHPADVIAGSLIGYSCAKVMYRLWYPSIESQQAGVPLYEKSLNDN